MLRRKIILFILVLNLSCVGYSAADDFIEELFAPIQITEVVKADRQYPPLSESDKTNLLNAKNSLIAFLKCMKIRDCEPLSYLSINLRPKYADRFDLYRNEFGAEALLKIEIFDFLIQQQTINEIIFYTALTETSEGVDITTQTAFALVSVADQWKISRFYRDIKSRKIEQRMDIKK